ncbi:TolC family outer membrane protein [Pigmentiphaga sp.]|uniref:TolC family outer membrane protein n=1 Tax=Pigmentiphaga sp. TaxID=1977564 RepID=UPI00128D5253|nr:TolC family outer membrane protein [Pigmentiphaga sp.]MPS27808.1 channel protein TolC [Alcaligenaceae bacterium SAGV5]MPS51013.1 channel protein TolC [Alcaligenaceae bacterium SAGV3]MPT55830.1 channel protein TolC [Alcaligenaceae bacterium]
MRARSYHVQTLCALLGACVFVPAVAALDLEQAYQAALANDATFASVRSAYTATLEKLPQARAALMPAISLAGSRAEASTTRLPGVTYTNETYTLQLIQPLFRWSGWQTYEQSKLQLAVGEAQLAQGRQDLILRVAQAYFDVLSAQDNLAFIGAQKIAISEQLESAKRNFEIGTATITDTYEAQARYDLAQAQEIQAESDLAVRIGALQQIIGAPSGDLAKLPPAVNVPAPQPARIDAWTEQATANNLAVAQATLNSEIAQRGIEIAKSGHYPSFDLTANVARTRGLVGQTVVNDFYTTRSVGVQVSVPIFAGFGTTSKVDEAVALSEKARNDLEVARRAAVQNTRIAFQGVNAGLAQVRALEAAQVSSRSALDANKTGYEVGVRINIDVLNAQQQLYSTERDLAKARYDALLSGLRLKAASGILSEDDVRLVNALLR